MLDNEHISMDVPTQRGPERRGWHIDRTVSVGEIVTALAVVTSIALYGAKLEARQDVADNRITMLERQRAEDRQTTEAKLTDLQTQLRTMDTRMTDRLEKIADKVGAAR